MYRISLYKNPLDSSGQQSPPTSTWMKVDNEKKFEFVFFCYFLRALRTHVVTFEHIIWTAD